MSRRPPHRAQQRGDIFGPWVGIVALTASRTAPLPEDERRRMSTRLHISLSDIEHGASPAIESWRDITDAVNFIQSAVEKDWAADPDQAVGAAKAALLDGHAHAVAHGVVRMTAESIAGIRNLLEQFDGILAAVSAHSYWQMVLHTQKRVARIVSGAKKRGDVVVQL